MTDHEIEEILWVLRNLGFKVHRTSANELTIRLPD